MRRTMIVGAVLLALLTSSCVVKTIEGSGNIVTETRHVSGFERISLSNIGVAVLTQGDSEGLCGPGEKMPDNLQNAPAGPWPLRQGRWCK